MNGDRKPAGDDERESLVRALQRPRSMPPYDAPPLNLSNMELNRIFRSPK